MADTLVAEPRLLVEPGQRGTLVIHERVVERIAQHAALAVPGVVARGSTLGRVTGRDLPRAEATVAGDRARVGVEIALTWPTPLAPTCAAVRDRVRDQVSAWTGCTVDVVDVRVAALVHPSENPPERSLS